MALALDASLEPERLAARLFVDTIPAGAYGVTIRRIVLATGESFYVRGAGAPTGLIIAGATSVVVRDFELPFNVELQYEAQAVNASGAAVGSPAVDLFEIVVDPSSDPWVMDIAVPANSQPVVVESLAELDYETPVGVHRVLDRRDPVLTTAPAFTPSFELVVCTMDDTERQRLRNTIGAGLPVLLRTPPEQGVGNLYLGVTGFKEERVSRLAFFQERRWTLAAVQLERPDPALYVPQAPNTYAQLKASVGQYADLVHQTYEQIAYTYTEGSIAPEWPPWPSQAA